MDQGRTDDRTAMPLQLVRLLRFVAYDRRTEILATGATAVAVAVAVCWGAAMLQLERHFAALRDAGEGLSGPATLLAEGSAAVTVAPGWIAAAFFATAVVRLRRGAPEPPISRDGRIPATAAEIRAALRREYHTVAASVIGVAAVALLDLGRLGVVSGAALAGDPVASSTLPMLAAEVAGILAATGALAAWALSFRDQLERLGAL